MNLLFQVCLFFLHVCCSLLRRFVRMLFINQALICSTKLYIIYTYYMLLLLVNKEVCLFNFRNIIVLTADHTRFVVGLIHDHGRQTKRHIFFPLARRMEILVIFTIINQRISFKRH